MFKSRLAISAALTTLCLVAAPIFAAGEGWTDDFEAAKKQAADESKDLILDFTGSDWCGWCIKLDEEVFSKDKFKQFAEKKFVLVEVDFPNDKSILSDETQAQNNKLKEEFGVRGFPSIYLADSEGKPYAKTGYRFGGPEAYSMHLSELMKKKTQRDTLLADAEEAAGLMKARLLHDAMQVVGDDIAAQHYRPVIDQIIALDAENQLGLNDQYTLMLKARAQESSLQSIRVGVREDPNGTIAKLDGLVADEETIPSIRQQALFFKYQIQLALLKDKPAAKLSLMQAIEADPESGMADRLRKMLEKNFGDAA